MGKKNRNNAHNKGRKEAAHPQHYGQQHIGYSTHVRGGGHSFAPHFNRGYQMQGAGHFTGQRRRYSRELRNEMSRDFANGRHNHAARHVDHSYGRNGKNAIFIRPEIISRPPVNLEETFSEANFESKAEKREANIFVFSQMTAALLLAVSGHMMEDGNPVAEGRINAGWLNFSRNLVWFMTHLGVSHIKDKTFMEKDMLRAGVNLAGAFSAVAAYSPQFLKGLQSESGALNGDSVGALLSMAAYAGMAYRQWRVRHNLKSCFNFLSQGKAENLKDFKYERDTREMMIGYSAGSEALENVAFKWLPASFLFGKGMAYLWASDNAAMLVSALLFSYGAAHELWRHNADKIKGLAQEAWSRATRNESRTALEENFLARYRKKGRENRADEPAAAGRASEAQPSQPTLATLS